MLPEEGTTSGSTSTTRHQTRWYWLLTRNTVSGLDVYTEGTPSGELLLPVFGSEEDALAYLSDVRGEWKPRKTGRGELVSVLMGVCGEVRWVALDPPPSMAAAEILKLVSLSREGFLEPLLGRGRSWLEEERKRQRFGVPSRGPRSRATGRTALRARSAP